jgi:hypothetical protein
MNGDCIEMPDNELRFVWFFGRNASVKLRHSSGFVFLEIPSMFVFDRSAFAVLLPLLMLAGVVVWSKAGLPPPPAATHSVGERSQERAAPAPTTDHTVAASLPSR